MAWFQYSLSHTTPEAIRALSALPGVVVGRDRSVMAQDNSGWLVERVLEQGGLQFRARLMTPDFKPLAAIEDLVKVGLREWVPNFMAPYQKEAVLELGHKSGHIWHAAGSGKTLTAIAWALAWPGNTVVTTRAAVRRNYGREIERFTTHRAYVIESIRDADLQKIEDAEALCREIGLGEQFGAGGAHPGRKARRGVEPVGALEPHRQMAAGIVINERRADPGEPRRPGDAGIADRRQPGFGGKRPPAASAERLGRLRTRW